MFIINAKFHGCILKFTEMGYYIALHLAYMRYVVLCLTAHDVSFV